MKKLAIAGASVALAAMLVVGVFAAEGDITGVTDTTTLTVAATCTFNTGDPESPSSASNQSYSDTVLNGHTASLTNGSAHKFTVFCNDKDGWKVTAGVPADLAGTSGSSHVIDFVDAALDTSGTEGQWNAIVSGAGAATAAELATDSGLTTVGGTYYIKPAGGIIAQEGASTDGSTFTVTYGAYVGTKTAADTYSGTIGYTLAAL